MDLWLRLLAAGVRLAKLDRGRYAWRQRRWPAGRAAFGASSARPIAFARRIHEGREFLFIA